MSMLAERKKRQKWSLNPRGTAWLNDKNKFGQKILENMGWSPGEGLGAQKQGIKENLKTRVKSDTAGLGFKNNSEEWLKQQSEFSDLLANLSGSNTEVEDDDVSTSAGRNSLELKSKQSRARVHYHKFTRGKDLSQYSTKDLAQILGPDTVNGGAFKKSSEGISNHISCGSMADYFKRKGLSWPVNGNSNNEKTQNAEPENDSKSLRNESLADDDDAIQHTEKKYKDKNCIPLCMETDNSVIETRTDLINNEQKSRKEKKKKGKHNQSTDIDNNERDFDNDNSVTLELKENCTLENNSNTVENNSSIPQSDKKKRKKRKQHIIDTNEGENSMDKDNNNYAEGCTESNSYVSSSKKKKKR